jgi:hypothetical protein
LILEFGGWILAVPSRLELHVDEAPRAVEQKFTKSASNRLTENLGLVVLLRDARFQVLARDIKREVAERLGIYSEFKTNAFDAVMTDVPVPPLTAFTLDEHFDKIRLVEMKTTRRPIRDVGLGGFFFGATKREYDLAARLGDRYLFAFVVLSLVNKFGSEFFVLLTHDELEQRTRTKRIQFQVNLESSWTGAASRFGHGPVVSALNRAAEEPTPYG